MHYVIFDVTRQELDRLRIPARYPLKAFIKIAGEYRLSTMWKSSMGAWKCSWHDSDLEGNGMTNEVIPNTFTCERVNQMVLGPDNLFDSVQEICLIVPSCQAFTDFGTLIGMTTENDLRNIGCSIDSFFEGFHSDCPIRMHNKESIIAGAHFDILLEERLRIQVQHGDESSINMQTLSGDTMGLAIHIKQSIAANSEISAHTQRITYYSIETIRELVANSVGIHTLEPSDDSNVVIGRQAGQINISALRTAYEAAQRMYNNNIRASNSGNDDSPSFLNLDGDATGGYRNEAEIVSASENIIRSYPNMECYLSDEGKRFLYINPKSHPGKCLSFDGVVKNAGFPGYPHYLRDGRYFLPYNTHITLPSNSVKGLKALNISDILKKHNSSHIQPDRSKYYAGPGSSVMIFMIADLVMIYGCAAVCQLLDEHYAQPTKS